MRSDNINMTNKNNKCKVWSILIITLLVFSGLFMFMPLCHEIDTVIAGSTWTQTTDRDFNNGTFMNTTINKRGVEAELVIDLSEFNEWNKKTLSNYPNVISQHAMASVWGTDKVVLFGGGFPGGAVNETWIYDLSENTWTRKFPQNKPPARCLAAMVSIHKTDKVLIFGGSPDSGGANSGLNDTWVYDLSENNWTRINPQIKPGARYCHAMASIYNDDKVVLFGGFSYLYNTIFYYYNDTWIFDCSNETWTRKNLINCPNASSGNAMAAIYGTDKIIYFGGGYLHGYVRKYLSETWIYDLSANTWVKQILAHKPPLRLAHAMVSIYETDKVLLFGGYYDFIGGTPPAWFEYNRNDTWVYDLSDNKWTEKKLKMKPEGRHFLAMATVYRTDKIVLYGGMTGYHDYSFFNDTWVYEAFLPMKNGTYVSAAYDTHSNSSFKTIGWDGTTPENTSIQFQLRTAAEESMLITKTFVGPDGSTTTYYTISGEPIWPGHTGERWIQFKAYLNISIYSGSPTLKDITISYNCLPETIVIAPNDNCISINNKPVFKWTFVDYDSEQQKSFQVLIDDYINFENTTFDSGVQTTAEQRWEFPMGTSYAKLPDGTWYWKVRTKDEDDEWTEYSAPRELIIDTQAPSSTTIIPTNNGFYCNMANIFGKASDAIPGSGLNKIEITIQRFSDNYFWNGTAWITFPTWLLADGTINWEFDSSNVPWLSGNKYSVKSRAIDNALIIEQSDFKNVFTIDRENPLSTINIPDNHVWLNKLNSISGLSFDSGGSDINKVEISIKCIEDNTSWNNDNENNEYWNGTAWNSNIYWLRATGTNQWSYFTGNISWSTGKQYIIQSRATDNANNIEVPIDGISFRYDDQPPEMLAIYINTGDEYTTSTSIILSLQAEDIDSGISQMSFSFDGTKWSAWEPFNTTRAFELPAGDSSKSVYFKVQDLAGNIAEPVFDTIVLDTTPPQDLCIVIDDNGMYTNSTNIKLNLNATDSLSGLDDMSFSYDKNNWFIWESFKGIKYFSLLPGDGEKIIYFRVRDILGNTAEPISDTIILDTTPPHSLSILINNGASETNSTSVTLQLNAIDNLSGLSQISLSSDGNNWSDWENFSWTKSYNLTSGEGKKTIYFKVKDRVGNIADPVSASILFQSSTIKQIQTPEKPSGLEFWYILLIIIVIILIVIIIVLGIVLKRKKSLEQKLLSVGTLTIKPDSLPASITTHDQVPAPPQVAPLPSKVTTTASQIITSPASTGVPKLSKSAQSTQELTSQLTPQDQKPQVPALPPAKGQEIKSETVKLALEESDLAAATPSQCSEIQSNLENRPTGEEN